MKRILIPIILLVLNSLSFAQFQNEVLENAYQIGDHYQAGYEFFHRWQKEYSPITDEEFNKLPDTEKEVHRIFTLLFQPFNPYNIYDSYIRVLKYRYKDSAEIANVLKNFEEDKGLMYNKAIGLPNYIRFVVVQDKIKYGFIDSVDFNSVVNEYMKQLPEEKEHIIKLRKSIEDTLTKLNYDEKILLINRFGLIWNPPINSWTNYIYNFRPKTDMKYLGKYNQYLKVLYQSPFYDTILNKFMYNPKTEEIYKSLMEKHIYARSRHDFISFYTPIEIDYSNRYYFNSFPSISEIVFLSSFNKAFVSTYLSSFAGYFHIEFIVEKVNDEWVIKYQK